MKQIICAKWGNKYSYHDVNNLYYMVKNNITPPFSFTCFTDNSDNFNSNINTFPIPQINFEIKKYNRKFEKGVWDKLKFLNKTLGDLEGTVLFLDLDIVIVNNIDCFFEYGDQNNLILGIQESWLLESFFIKKGQTSFYRFPVGKLYPLLENYRKNQEYIQNKYCFEQSYISNNSPIPVEFWPLEWTCHFRNNCVPTFPLNYFYIPSFNDNCKILNFCGDTKINDAINGIYYFDKYYSPLQHLYKVITTISIFNLFKFLTAIRKFMYPSEWIKNYLYEKNIR